MPTTTHRRLALRVLAAATLLAGTSACLIEQGGDIDPETGLSAEAQNGEQVIIGTLNWDEVNTLPSNSAERINSRAVGYISIPAKGTRCTGFLINDNTVMTNEHCISSQSEARGATVYFRREAGVPFSEWASFSCSTYIGDNSSLDYALIQCQGAPGQTHGVVELSSAAAQVNQSLYVIQQNCDYYEVPGCSPNKKIARGQVTRVDSEVRHNADTLGGSSGSPVFDATTHKVFALHHVGVGNNGSGRGSYNYAVKMGNIINDIESRFPSVTFGGGAAPVDPAPSGDAFEPNNTSSSATATDLPFDIDGLTITSGDVDVFEVTLDGPGTLNVDLLFSHEAGDLDLTVHGAAGPGSAAIVSATSANDDETVQKGGLAAGTYYVVVYGYNGAANSYDLSLSVTLDAPIELAPTEPAPSGSGVVDDGSIATARPINNPFTGSYAIDAAGDEDYFAFSTNGGTTSITLTFSNSVGDLDLYLYDGAAEAVANSLSVSDTEQISRNLAAGTYYVRVIGYSGATGDYTLDVR